MEFSLLNHEPETKNIIEKLEKFGFDKITIDKKECLSFIEILDFDYNSCITRIVYNEEYQLCLHIYRLYSLTKSIDIPLKIIETIDSLRNS